MITLQAILGEMIKNKTDWISPYLSNADLALDINLQGLLKVNVRNRKPYISGNGKSRKFYVKV